MSKSDPKELPLLVMTTLIPAIRADRKTVTRRVVRPQPEWLAEVTGTTPLGGLHWPLGRLGQQCGAPIRCPYGVPGDHLWVRETFYVDTIPSGRLPKDPGPDDLEHLYYAADGGCCDQIPECQCATEGRPRWRPSIHMPRWASRILLEATDVRAERLHAITTEDIHREGTHLCVDELLGRPCGCSEEALRADFAVAWDAKNAKRGYGWRENPWVWRVAFRRLHG